MCECEPVVRKTGCKLSTEKLHAAPPPRYVNVRPVKVYSSRRFVSRTAVAINDDNERLRSFDNRSTGPSASMYTSRSDDHGV